jgi:Probable Zinc-ribbon domain
MSKSKYQPEKYSAREKLINGLRGEAVSTTHPILTSQWLPDSFGPDCFTHGSTRLVSWVCENAHYFQAPVCSRTRAIDTNSKFKGCPYCAGRLSALHEGLARRFPELAKEWSEENGSADFVRSGSRQTALWTCCKGHMYACMILARTEEEQSCPQCYVGERIDLALMPAKTSIEFVRSNTDARVGSVTLLNFGYDCKALPISHKMWWQCKVNPQHSFYRSVDQLRETNFGCPKCQRQNTGTLADYPELVAQLHPSLNGKIDPTDLFAGSNKCLWWLCKKHPKLPWQAQVYKRTLRGDGCPYCSKKRASADNCLAATHPHIAREWHPTRNGLLTPSAILATSTVICWWLCPCGTEYSRQVCGRIRSTGCTKCKSNAGVGNFPIEHICQKTTPESTTRHQ